MRRQAVREEWRQEWVAALSQKRPFLIRLQGPLWEAQLVMALILLRVLIQFGRLPRLLI